jgi:hypothetical protein
VYSLTSARSPTCFSHFFFSYSSISPRSISALPPSFSLDQGVIFSAPDALGRLPLDASVRLRLNGSSLPDTRVHFEPGDWRQQNFGPFRCV